MEKILLKINDLKENALGPIIKKYWPLWLTPNLLAYFKFLMAALIVYGCFDFSAWKNSILVLFASLMILDLLDGIVARQLDMITKIGAFLDPATDKMTTIPILFALLGNTLLPWLLVGMDLLLALIAIVGKFVLKADVSSGIWGKTKLHLIFYGSVILMISENNLLGLALLWLAVPFAIASIIGHLEPFLGKK